MTDTEPTTQPTDAVAEPDVTPLNLTPHDVVVFAADGVTQQHVFKSAGCQLRMGSSAPQKRLKTLDATGVEVWSEPVNDVLELHSLPEDVQKHISNGRPLIVSTIVAQGLRGHATSVYVPDSGPDSVVRGPAGAILGVKRLYQI